MDYTNFLKSKELKSVNTGFETKINSPYLFDWQQKIVEWALRKGKAAIFANCGLGKTRMQLEWAQRVCQHTNGKALILSPLAVAKQTQREGIAIGIPVTLCKDTQDVTSGINITNYERTEKFDLNQFTAVVLDESSILKSYSGAYKQMLINACRHTPYRLCCTATPSPNDYMELGNHSEFLSVMNRAEMLATYFVHDGGDTSKWRLKGHAEDGFWKWVGTWAVMLRSPLDLGYENEDFILPELWIHEHIISSSPDEGMLYAIPASTLNERRQARRDSLQTRIDLAANLVNNSDDYYLVWCNLNDESKALANAINYSNEVRGSDSPEYKEETAVAFAEGRLKALISKPRIFGYGLNFQVCHNMIFCGLSDSYEELYQSIRRCWRFGQDKPVNVHIILSEKEINVLENIKRKEADLNRMQGEMIKYARIEDIFSSSWTTEIYTPQQEMRLPIWLAS